MIQHPSARGTSTTTSTTVAPPVSLTDDELKRRSPPTTHRGRQLQARRHAEQAAVSAARAAIQMDGSETYADWLHGPSAIARGQGELAARGVTGTVTVSGQTVIVAVTVTVDFEILPGSRTVTETATADPSRGVTTGIP